MTRSPITSALGTLFANLRRDVRGNTLALIAAALIPLLGLIGGGVDMSRLYLTKARLQQACDAGALAGRKAMANSTWTTTGANSTNSIALAMFGGNFQQGDYGTTGLSNAYSESSGAVSGTATVSVPMSIMRVFGITSRSITVNCQTRLDLPDTDVMFVLDMSGSMNCVAGDTSCSNNGNIPAPGSKINGLKSAIKCFYEALVKVNTTEVCGNDPTATTSTQTAQIRIGFVPYAVNVNVGKLLPQSYIADQWAYQTRVANFQSSHGNQVFQNWTYKQATLDVSGLKSPNGTSWNNSVRLPVGSSGTNTSVTWDGCIEERQTVKNSDGNPSDEWDPIPSAAYDMDIDLIPSASTPGSQWGPMLDGAVWYRYAENNPTQSNWTTTSDGSVHQPSDIGEYYCNTQAQKLTQWNTPAPFETYVNSLTARGNTYHDIGMIWGARLISPTGLFASENNNLPEIQRNIIFMTDGDTRSFNIDYNSHGLDYWDRRQTTYTPDNSPYSYYNDNNKMNQIINARLSGLCTAIKNRNIKLWVISYGGGVSSTTESRLQTCASPGSYFAADDSAMLISQFRQIAARLTKLRLTQ